MVLDYKIYAIIQVFTRYLRQFKYSLYLIVIYSFINNNSSEKFTQVRITVFLQ